MFRFPPYVQIRREHSYRQEAGHRSTGLGIIILPLQIQFRAVWKSEGAIPIETTLVEVTPSRNFGVAADAPQGGPKRLQGRRFRV
jgi:hypothetical protein